MFIRGDLPPGDQIAQAIHASVCFAMKYPHESNAWNDTSGVLVVVNVRNEDHLLDIADMVYWNKVPYTLFWEPDLSDHTALAAVLSAEQAKKYAKGLPLALVTSSPHGEEVK
ncbi:MAG TPA: peptidyl-tRNA hydrolase [Nitrososphaera sp.]|nr:peptidyl-tRNA hydrolase [Nitrososphaera sp.]